MKAKQSKPSVNRISIARLYNIGNYEHVRYELSVDVPQGASAKVALLDISRILAALRPIKKPFNYDHMKQALAKDPGELSEREKDNIYEYAEEIAEYTKRCEMRNDALNMLDALGGTSRRDAAKEQWDDEIPF